MDNTKLNNINLLSSLRTLTSARIGLGRTGNALPLQETLAFKTAHAHARDAVFSTLDIPLLVQGINAFALPFYVVKTKATDRPTYLKRPDLGRSLDGTSLQELHNAYQPAALAVVVADGLSAGAINLYAIKLLQQLLPLINQQFTVAPIVIAEQARVAIGDEVACMLGAKSVLVLIGERPGLSTPESMGAYLTYQPVIGCTDEARNCISNIHDNGLNTTVAAEKIAYLLQQMHSRKISGVTLKDTYEQTIVDTVKTNLITNT